MKKSFLIIFVLLNILSFTNVYAQLETMTNTKVVSMVKAGFGEQLIIGKIQNTNPAYNLNVDSITWLKNNGVNETIITAMLNAKSNTGMVLNNERDYTPFEIGPELGLSLARFLGNGVNEPYYNTRFLIRLPVGVNSQILFTRVVGIDIGLFYNNKGVKYVALADDAVFTVVTLDYIDMPILLHLQFGSPNTKFIINAGPSVAFAASGKIIYYQGGHDETDKINWSTSTYSRFDLAANMGIGIQQKAGPGDFSALVTGNYGLIDQNTATDGINANIIPHNLGLSFTLSYLFDFGKSH